MIPQSIVDLLGTGVSVMVGTRDASLVPECTRAWGIRVGGTRESVTIFLSKRIAGKTIDNLRDNGQIAVTCTRPTDHITCQLKGHVGGMQTVTSSDREVSRRWHLEFMAELRAIGVPSALCEAWNTEPDLAVEIAVAEVFDQTPGPGAGKKIDR
jgi:hypothetical protein